MRRLLHAGLDTFQFLRLHSVGVPLNFLSEPLQEFALLNDDAVQLLHLMFEVRKVCFEPVHALGIFICHH